MAEYKSYLVPLTGSSFDRVEHLKIPLKENPDFYLYYHLERPPLVYILMIISTAIFGNSEWVYRLPSFIFGMLTIVCLIVFAKKEKGHVFAISVGVLSLITSIDLWLSSQYAQLDTGITLFLFLSLLALIYDRVYLSGVFFGLALLSKLQPAVIFIFPLLYLFIIKKITFSKLLKFILGAVVILLPWAIYLILKFGIKDVVQVISGFALTSAATVDIHQKAPFFWYIRWWWETLRPGWTIFLALVLYDITLKNLNWKKITLLIYIFGGLLAFSIPVNKIWWYVLPLIPAICFYIFLSVEALIQKKKNAVNNITLITLLASLPIFLKSSSLIIMIYGILITFIAFMILRNKLTIKTNFRLNTKIIFYFSVILSLLLFSLQFPKITPYHQGTKPVALYYKSLPNPKCLWLKDMPAESVLFYSNAGVVPVLTETNEATQIFSNCKNNFLITPQNYTDGEPIFRVGNIRLYKLPV